MEIRYATKQDLPAIFAVYAAAKLFMREHGNPTQWDSNYPSEKLLLSDIDRKSLYVIESDNKIHAVFALIQGPDPTYRYIDGKWLSDSKYYVIHRIASDNTLHGILPFVLSFAYELTKSIRIDTHADNTVMQHLLLKNGFYHCGTIYLSDGNPRLAYQKDIE